MENIESANHYDDEIDLRELFDVLWAGKFLIVAITVVFAIGSVLFALSIPNQYKSTAILAPAQSDSSGLSTALGQLGGLASLAGVSLGEGGSSEAQIAQEIMKSWSFIEGFIADNSLEVQVYAANGWDIRSRELRVDDDIYDKMSGEWFLKDPFSGGVRRPSSWELFDRFRKMLSISHDQQSGLVSVSIEYYSPDLAKKWVDLYVATINQHMQTRQVARVASNISYLEDQIAKTSIAEMREVFYTIIEEQTKNKMVAEASPDYVFVTVSPSMVEEEKSRPSRALICIAITILGGLMGVGVTLLRHILANQPD